MPRNLESERQLKAEIRRLCKQGLNDLTALEKDDAFTTILRLIARAEVQSKVPKSQRTRKRPDVRNLDPATARDVHNRTSPSVART